MALMVMKRPRAGLQELEKVVSMEAGTLLRAYTCPFPLLGHASRPKELRQMILSAAPIGFQHLFMLEERTTVVIR